MIRASHRIRDRRRATPTYKASRSEFWEKTRSTDRCGSCHNETVGQTPMFVRTDDVNLAYDDAIGKIDRDLPSLSEFVAKVSSPPIGHNCWVEDPEHLRADRDQLDRKLGRRAGGRWTADRLDATRIDRPDLEQELPGRPCIVPATDSRTDSRGVLLSLSQFPVAERAAALFRGSGYQRRL